MEKRTRHLFANEQTAMAKSSGVKPPIFTGRADEDADSFVKSFERYLKFRDITEDSKKLNLFAVLLKDSAAQWLDGLPESSKDSYAHLLTEFAQRYRLPESLKFKCASDLFSKKQSSDESVDDYVTQMRKIARLIGVDDNILKFILLNGLKPYISAQVTQAHPESIEKILEIARLAELTMPKATASDSMVCEQLVEMQAEMRRLSTKVDKAMTATVHPRSPTPERRVQFTQPESPEPTASTSTYIPRIRPRNVNTFHPRNFHPAAYNEQRQIDCYQQRQQGAIQPHQQNSPNQQPTGLCTRCARNHGRNSFCPARDPRRVCNFCHKPGHFQAACFSAPKQF